MPETMTRLRAAIQRRLFTFMYHQGAMVYDKLTDWFFLGEWSRWQGTVWDYLPPDGAILELGCGTGRLASWATVAGWRWIALDRSPAMIARTRRQLGSDQPAIICADARHLPFAERSFDGMVATFPAPFIFAPETVREMARVLRPGGIVVIVVSAELSGNDWRHRWRRRLLDVFYGPANSPPQPAHGFPDFSQNAIEHDTAFGHAHLLLMRLTSLPS